MRKAGLAQGPFPTNSGAAMTEAIEEGKSNWCEFCLDAGKFYGYISPDFVLIDCSCGHEDNPIKTKDDPRWEEFQRRWASMNGNVKQ